MKAVIFDLFHTLTAPESKWSELPSTCELLGLDRRLWDGLITTGSRWRLAGEERDPCRIVGRLARELDPAITDEIIRRAAETRVLRMRHSLERIPPENVATVKRLRQAGFALGLVSNADAIEHAAWSYSPLAGCFDVEVFSCEAGCVKPEPAIFQKCLAALRQQPRDCLFVGDGGSDELLAARELGMKTALVSGSLAELWPEKIAERLRHADHHIRWIPEVEALLGLVHREKGGD